VNIPVDVDTGTCADGNPHASDATADADLITHGHFSSGAGFNEMMLLAN
jgi:hypothetical protein